MTDPEQDRVPKTFVLGAGEWLGLDSGDWLGELPNLADWDRIIISAETLASALLERQEFIKTLEPQDAPEELRRIKDALSTLRLQLAKVLATNGVVVAIVHPSRSVCQVKEPIYKGPIFVSSKEWIPVPLAQMDEPGDTVNVLEAMFRPYFDQTASWTETFGIKKESCELSERLNVDIEKGARFATQKMATDRQGNAIGLATYVQSTTTVGKPLSGKFICLVPTTRINDRAAVALLLKTMFGIAVDTPPPAWLESIKVHGEEGVRAEIADARRELESAEATLVESELQLSSLREPLKVLYQQHLPLQSSCQDVFERMGIATKPSEVSDEFVLELEGAEILVEVKSKARRSAGLDDVGQLFRDMGDFIQKRERPIKGLLVANAWAVFPPDERETASRATFPTNVVEFAERQGIALLSTPELIRAYELVQQGKQSGNGVFKMILETSGAVSFGPTESHLPE